MFEPVDFGNALLKAERINSLRYNRDPNNPRNQLAQARLNQLNTPSGPDPTSNMRDIMFLRKMKEQGYPDAEIRLMEDAISKRWYGDVGGAPGYAQGGVFNQMISGRDQAAADAYSAYMKDQGKLLSQSGERMQAPNITLNPKDVDLGGYQASPVSAADVAAQKVTAQEQAKADVKQAVEQSKNERAYIAYQAGLGRLVEALQSTNTGFLAGRIPAATANAQVAENARAIMLPILKTLVRESGEGVFTDKDAEAILAMLPDRVTDEKAIDEVIKNIDTYVQGKLGMLEETKTINWSDL